MADFIFNVSKGRWAEFFNRVDQNDPTNAAIIIVPVDVGGTSDATIKDFLTLSAVTGGGVTERTTGGWNRKTLVDSDIATISADTANDRMDVTTADYIWTAVSAGAVTDLLICYDADTTGGTDANIIPIAQMDFAITPDGSDVTADVGAVLLRAS